MSDFLHEQMARKMFENYESPIERICREVMADRVEQEENALVYRVSVEVGYNINKEELIKALQYDRNQYQKGFEDCARSMRLEQTDCISIPKDATNGDVIKAMFPQEWWKLKIDKDLEWWDAPYKAESEDKE